MIDSYGRSIDSLRISVTDRCNLRCSYCMPPGTVPRVRRRDILTFEEICEVVRAAVAMGTTRIRLTGGEPLVCRDLVALVRMLASIHGVRDLSMTTNGTLLARHACGLAAAGLRRVNVSLDAVDPARYAAITRGGDVRQVLAGIAAAVQAGLAPVRLNCVVEADPGETDARDVARFAAAAALELRFIRRMDLARGRFAVVQGGLGGDCPRCNRLRLSSDGRIRPCLFSNLSFSVRELGPAQALQRAVRVKPRAGSACTDVLMHAIGG
jgi:cyclic pyranopterin phosphate synthase